MTQPTNKRLVTEAAQATALAGTVAKGTLFFNIVDYGATLNGTTDDTTAINLAIAAAAAKGPRVRLLVPAPPSGSLGAKITDTITIPGNVDIQMQGAFIYAGAAGKPALVVGETGSNKHWSATHLLRVIRSTISSWTDETDIGIKLINQNASDITVALVDGFTIGLQCIGNGTPGFAYNTLRLGRLNNNKIQIDETNINTGWFNENTFIGGNLNNTSTTYTTLDRTGVRITSADGSYLSNNNNRHIGLSFELRYGTTVNSIPVDAVNCGPGNTFELCRLESNTATPGITRNNSKPLYFHASYDNDTQQLVSDLGTYAGTVVEGEYTRVADTAKRLVVKAEGLHKRACYYDSTKINVPGVAVQTSGTSVDDARANTLLTINAAYLGVPNTRMIGVYVSTRRMKRFTLAADTEAANGGRWRIRAYDSSGTILSAAGTVRTNNASAFAYATSFGGAWATGTDSNLPRHITVSDATDYIFVGVSGGTADAQIRSFAVYSLDHHAGAATWLPWVDNGENYAIAVPLSGTYEVGRRIWNAAPTSSSNTGWLCTAAGTPGTWRTYGEPPSPAPAGQPEFMSTLGNHPGQVTAATTSSNTFSSANQAILVRFKPFRDITVSELHWFVFATSSGNYDIGIYTAAGTKLWSTGSSAWPTVSAIKVETVSGGISLVANTEYLLALSGDNTTGTWRGANEGVTDQIKMLDGTYFSRVVSSSFPLPSTITPGSSRAGKIPLITVHGT